MISLSIHHRDDYNSAIEQSSQYLRNRALNRVLKIATETEFQRKIQVCMIACLTAFAISISVVFQVLILPLPLSVAIPLATGFLYYRWTKPEYFEAVLPKDFVPEKQ